MADVASLAVALHLNAASFKSQITDAYNVAEKGSRKLTRQVEISSNASAGAIKQMATQAQQSSGQAAKGFGQLHHVLTELVSGSNVAVSTISKALVPAFERLFGAANDPSFDIQQRVVKEAAQSAVDYAQAAVEAAKADKVRAQQGLKTAQAMKAQAMAQREQAFLSDEHLEKLRAVSEQHGLNVAAIEKTHAAQHAANARAIAEANLAEVAASQKAASASAKLTAAQTAEVTGTKQLVVARQQLAVANTELTKLQRITGGVASGFHNLVNLMGGPVNAGLMAAAGAIFYLHSKFKETEAQTKSFNEAIAHTGLVGIATADHYRKIADEMGGTKAAFEAVTAVANAGFVGSIAQQLAQVTMKAGEAGFKVKDITSAFALVETDAITAMKSLTDVGVVLNKTVVDQVVAYVKAGNKAAAGTLLWQSALEALETKAKLASEPLRKLNFEAEKSMILGLAFGNTYYKAYLDQRKEQQKAQQKTVNELTEQQAEAIKKQKQYIKAATEAAVKKPATRMDYGQQRLGQLEKETISLQAQLRYTDKMTVSQKQLIAFEIELASWKGQTLSAQQQSILASREQIKAQLKSNAVIEKQLEDQKTLNDLIVKSIEEANKKGEEAAKRKDIKGGFQQGFKDFENEATNMFENVRNATKNAFEGMSNTLADFVTTGKFNFADFAQSVVNDITRMTVKMMIFRSLERGTKGTSFGGFLFGNAQGGVYNSPGLSAHRNTVVNSPTFFPFAKGMGLMGEAGPEAIMPLARGSDGSLGVRSAGGSSETQGITDIHIHQEINVTGNGDKALEEALLRGARLGADDALARIQRDFATNGRIRRLLGG
ncbi:MAG: phage tail tape measure C-terminal domain-containing protein [Candidatus Arsenophonus phytopathogenicus]